jgi:hypothetical protein
MRIAVCLSGQPRVIESIIPSLLHFFSGEHEYDFFCHAWDYNTYKRLKKTPVSGEWPVEWGQDEQVDVDELTHILSRLNPKKCVVDSKNVLSNHRFAWDSLFYSIMYANHLKKQYEIENNFRYDFVVRSRYDIVFHPSLKFILTAAANTDNYLDIYFTNTNRMDYEYNRINASDTVFYGSSMAMDIISDVHRDIYYKLLQKRLDDWECLGPGTSLSDYAEDRNLRLISLPAGEVYETVYREEMAPLDPITNWDKIKQYNDSFYKITP